MKIDFEEVDNLSDEELTRAHGKLFDTITEKLGADKDLLPLLLEMERELNLREGA